MVFADRHPNFHIRLGREGSSPMSGKNFVLCHHLEAGEEETECPLAREKRQSWDGRDGAPFWG